MFIFNFFTFLINIYLELDDRTINVNTYLDSNDTVEEILKKEKRKIEEEKLVENFNRKFKKIKQNRQELEQAVLNLENIMNFEMQQPDQEMEQADQEIEQPDQEMEQQDQEMKQQEEERRRREDEQFDRDIELWRQQEREEQRRQEQEQEQNRQRLRKMKQEEKQNKNIFGSIRKKFFNSMSYKDLIEAGTSTSRRTIIVKEDEKMEQQERMQVEESSSEEEGSLMEEGEDPEIKKIMKKMKITQTCCIEPYIDEIEFRYLLQNKKYEIYKMDNNQFWIWNLEQSQIFKITLPQSLPLPTNPKYLIRTKKEIKFVE